MTSCTDRELLNARIAELLHEFLVVIRNSTYPAVPGHPYRREELNDLADIAHNLPRYLVGHDEFAVVSAERLRSEVLKHVQRFYPGIDPNLHRYLRLLDLDAETFLARYRDHKWNAPESEPANALS